MAKQMGLMGLGCFIFMMLALQINGATATLYLVGDDLGWIVPPNTSFYTDWSNSKTFNIGDQVLFNLTENQDVGEVSTRAEYENCTKPGLTFLGPNLQSTFTLLQNGSRFFISSIDNHCEDGQKVVITVGSPTNTSAVPSSVSSLSFGVAFTVLSSMVVYFFA